MGLKKRLLLHPRVVNNIVELTVLCRLLRFGGEHSFFHLYPSTGKAFLLKHALFMHFSLQRNYKEKRLTKSSEINSLNFSSQHHLGQAPWHIWRISNLLSKASKCKHSIVASSLPAHMPKGYNCRTVVGFPCEHEGILVLGFPTSRWGLGFSQNHDWSPDYG